MARRRLTPAQPRHLAPVPPAEAHRRMDSPGPGLATPPIAQVAGEAATAAALRQMVDSVEAARAEGRMIIDVPLAEVSPGHLVRDRISLDREEIEALKSSIRENGQRLPAEITPLPVSTKGEGQAPYYWALISGWRRLRALSELYKETSDTRFSVLRAVVRPPETAAASYVAMVEENEIRVPLSYYERGRLVAEATARGVFPDQTTALRTLFATASRAKRSKIGSFVEIYGALGDVLNFPADIPERLGLQLVARLKAGDRSRIHAAIMEKRPATATAELALLSRLTVPPRTDVSRTKHKDEILWPGMTMKLARSGRKITLTLSGDEVNDALLEELRQVLRKMGKG